MASPLFQPPRFSSLREVVADAIRQAILDGSMKPGQKVMEAEIAAHMGISRSPVREALRQLEKDGLVRSIPNRGTIISDLSQEDLVQLYGIRGVLEGLAATWACEHAGEQDIAELRGLCREMRDLLPVTTEDKRVRFHRKDVEFHERLVRCAGSPLLAEVLAGIQLQIRMIMATTSVMVGDPAQAEADHEEMVEVIAKGDVVAAERLARDHVERPKRRLLQALAENGL